MLKIIAAQIMLATIVPATNPARADAKWRPRRTAKTLCSNETNSRQISLMSELYHIHSSRFGKGLSISSSAFGGCCSSAIFDISASVPFILRSKTAWDRSRNRKAPATNRNLRVILKSKK